MAEEEEKKTRIIITFESPTSCLAQVDFENTDEKALAPQLVLIGEFLALRGRQMWTRPEKTKQIIVPKPEGPPKFS